MKNALALLSSVLMFSFNSNAQAMDTEINFIFGTAFLAQICHVDFSTPTTARKNCSSLLGAGGSYTIKNKNINETFCISVMSWPILIPVLSEYYFKIDKNEDAKIEMWGASFNPQFQFSDSISLIESKAISAPSNYCTHIPSIIY
ncbi:hypothetical protein [Fluviispira sanaruensis]|uniref:Uncharacterized protein n=1 Tax=Fluviispira sanaruensis TaxID=2493639 RepID=A0A4P2VHI2_FLUSA|nr:hypothetical protein [Fluviispira sanaruensis]BBH52366.1 hypothetical protein JCM31447_08070 [Fluviispira sanaruensis]